MKIGRWIIIFAGLISAIIITRPSWHWTHEEKLPDITNFISGLKQIGTNTYELPDETMPDGIYDVTYVIAKFKHGVPTFEFGLYQPETHDDWMFLNASDFKMKEGDWFGPNQRVKIFNHGTELVMVGDKPVQQKKEDVLHKIFPNLVIPEKE